MKSKFILNSALFWHNIENSLTRYHFVWNSNKVPGDPQTQGDPPNYVKPHTFLPAATQVYTLAVFSSGQRMHFLVSH